MNCFFFNFEHRSPNGKSLSAWLSHPGPVFLRKFAKVNKYDDSVQEVQLLHANPSYATVRFKDGRESNVLQKDLAP